MPEKPLQVLLVEDNPGDARFLQEMLTEADIHDLSLHWVDELKKALACLHTGNIDVVLSDLNLPDSHMLDTFLELQKNAPSLPIVIMTGSFEEEQWAAEALRQGAQDYLIKGKIDAHMLLRTLRYAIERKRHQEVLKQYSTKLEGANHLKDLFMDIMRHDLMNPLAVIKQAAQLLKDTSKKEEDKQSLLAIDQSINKITEMIMGAQVYAKLEDVQKLTRKKISLTEILRNVVHNFQVQAKEKKITVELRAVEDIFCMAHSMIENVFSNLVSNAIKYSPESKKVEVGLTEEGPLLKIYVKDWGCGIPKDVKPKLFTRFQRADRLGIKGTGLGLAIVKRLVELHQGKVWIEDNPEGGSVFCVEIPR
ncbi:MAG: HAMP domain-containing histidine kinase [Chlamydiae bacterium]|nr:HAMP domain-containing histidine kinase [Chlamydiota bacterium]MBI3267366.1 HAMP domain-containing histidine kinase [Chlamydiota bacterium]